MTTNTARSGKVLVFDQKEEKAKVKNKADIMSFTRKIRNSGLNVSRVILAMHDIDVPTFFSIPQNDQTNYALVEIFNNSKNADPRSFSLEIKKAKGFLAANKISVVASKEFYNGDYPVCKIICKIK